jgi:predicted nucleic acid-binding protein
LWHLDASAVLDMWEDYPLLQFPNLWAWIAHEIGSGNLGISQIALDEVGNNEPACKTHLQLVGIQGIHVSADIARAAAANKADLNIVGSQYGAGLGENDIFIIATAKVCGATLITHEAIQMRLPANYSNYKIPAVCRLPTVSVPFCRIINYIKQSNKVF